MEVQRQDSQDDQDPVDVVHSHFKRVILVADSHGLVKYLNSRLISGPKVQNQKKTKKKKKALHSLNLPLIFQVVDTI